MNTEQMKRKAVSRFLGLLVPGLIMVGISCRNDHPVKKTDSPTQGTIYISVDESFKPVIQEEIKVYESSFPDAHIIASYKSEAACFRDLQKDSTRLIIVSRGLTDQENKYYKSLLDYKLLWDDVAFDAISVVVNTASADTVFRLNDLKKLLSDSVNKYQAVVDGNNETSTVRYLIDSLLNGKPLGANVKAANGSKAVLDYISENKNAVGFVGSSWVGNEEDPDQRIYDGKIKQALVACKTCGKNIFARPSQATIAYGQYPLVRPLYFILKENWAGLGTGFTGFMSLERGQLIFQRAYLVPAKIYFGVRRVNDL